MPKRRLKVWMSIFIAFVIALMSWTLSAEEIHSFIVLNRYPHDPDSFTQGLVFHGGFLYEGTGLYGKSSLRKVRLEDGLVLEILPLDEGFFGEGIAILGDLILQLTWKKGQGFVYDRISLKEIGRFRYEGEGWGLTTDGEYLIMSDGSHRLTYLDPLSYEPIKQIEVYGKEGPIYRLNELEYIKGEIFANIWYDHRICRIDPLTGQVRGWIDLTALYTEEKKAREDVDVLNGIAYDHENDRLFVTGKLWSHIYEIRLED